MKRILLILLIALVLMGCAQRTAVKQPSVDKASDVPVEDQAMDGSPGSATDVGLTQEDLDKLGADIQGIDAEDIGGLE